MLTFVSATTGRQTDGYWASTRGFFVLPAGDLAEVSSIAASGVIGGTAGQIPVLWTPSR